MLRLKHGLIFLLSFMLVSIHFAGSVFAASEDNLQITVNATPKVDVSLALGNTKDDGKRFKDDLTRLLRDRGLDPNVVNIQALESRDEQTFQGKFKMQVYWDNNGSDMDSWTLFKQNGTQIASMSYGSKTVYGSTLDTDDTSGGRGEWSTINFDGVPSNVDEIAFEVNPYRGSAYTSVRLFREQNGVQEKLIDAPQWVGQNGTNIRVYFGSFKRNAKGGWDFRYASTGQVFEGSKTVYTAKAFTEVLREPTWRDNSSRFIVNMNNDTIPDFDNQTALGEILTRLTNENINYIGVGSNTNQAQSNRFIQRNDNRGQFINSDTRTYDQYMNDIADYIREHVRTHQLSGSSQYALVDQNIDLEVVPREFKTNTETTLFPNGRWRLDHDENYFENGNGKYTKSGIYQPNLDVTLDKVGRYELWFGDLHPEPRYLYIHRKPVASYQVAVQTSGTNRTVTITDRSYDLDGQAGTSNGIAEYEWKWKKTTDLTWTDGRIPSTVPAGNDYIVQLRVKDYQDQWSDAVANYITTNSVTTKPIASFDLPFEELLYNNVKIQDISYDPSGRAITAREWVITNESGATVFTGATPPANFKTYGKGKYTVALRVKNDANLWSETFKRNINIVVDEVAPSIDINSTHADWTNQNVNVTATFDDKGGSGFKHQRVAITTSNTAPASTNAAWSAWGTDLRRDISITAEGQHYIHIEAVDNEGNKSTKTYGVYAIDKTKPLVDVAGDFTNVTHGDVTMRINPTDTASGINVVKVNGEVIPQVLGGWSYVATAKGSYSISVTDKAGNETVKIVNVDNIDKTISLVGPNISDFGNVRILPQTRSIVTDVSKIAVKDWRDTPNDWRLTVSATAFTSDSQTLDADIRLKGFQKVLKTSGSGELPALADTSLKTIQGTSQTLATARTARGEYEMSFPTDALQVIIDPARVKRGNYSSTITWSIVAAPE